MACSGHSGVDLTKVLLGRVGSHEHGGQVDDPVQAVRPADMGQVIVPLCPLQGWAPTILTWSPGAKLEPSGSAGASASTDTGLVFTHEDGSAYHPDTVTDCETIPA